MITPHLVEFQSLVEFINEEIVGAQLQEIVTSQWGLALGFYRYHIKPQVQWLIFDLDTQRPFLGIYNENPWARHKLTKPLGLFLNAHFKNNKIDHLQLVKNYGRVVEIIFNTQYRIEFRLIPRQPNFIASTDDKKMSWDKPKPLIESNEESFDVSQLEIRSVPYMLKQWLSEKSQISTSSKSKVQATSPFELWMNQRKRDIEKKLKALEALDKQIKNPQIKVLRDIGEHLKTYGFKNIHAEWLSLINQNQTVSWNINKCFEKAKLAESKINGARKRALIIKDELKVLTDQIENSSEEKFQQHISRQSEIKLFQVQKRKNEGSFRKLTLDEQYGINCYMGKSAAENLKLLRQSKSWDIWIHLKDYPSAYAIIQKNKDQSISDDYLKKSAQWLAKESVKSKDISGLKVSVVIVECRHVRPIKGDKIGRVTYHHAREMLISI